MANLKARDLEGVCKANGFEKGVLMICTHIIERLNDFEAGLTINAQLMDKQTDLISAFSTIAGNMKDVIEDLKPTDKGITIDN